MKSNLAPVLLILGLMVSTVFTWWKTDFSASGAVPLFIGIVGSNCSILGILYTLYQLYQIRKETDVIKSAGDEMRKRLLELKVFGDMSSGISLIQDIQNNLRAKKSEVALLKVQDLKRIVAYAKSRTQSDDVYAMLDADMVRLNNLVSTLELDLEEKRRSLVVPRVNGELEQLRDRLIAISENLK